jgi:hypothetical protein
MDTVNNILAPTTGQTPVSILAWFSLASPFVLFGLGVVKKFLAKGNSKA